MGSLSMHSKCLEFFSLWGRGTLRIFFGEGKEKNIAQHAK
jgi:hypothetical protein